MASCCGRCPSRIELQQGKLFVEGTNRQNHHPLEWRPNRPSQNTFADLKAALDVRALAPLQASADDLPVALQVAAFVPGGQLTEILSVQHQQVEDIVDQRSALWPSIDQRLKPRMAMLV